MTSNPYETSDYEEKYLALSQEVIDLSFDRILNQDSDDKLVHRAGEILAELSDRGVPVVESGIHMDSKAVEELRYWELSSGLKLWSDGLVEE